MSRRRRAEKREVLTDPKYGDVIVTKFMNYVMYEGKKAVAENIVYGAFDIMAAKRRDVDVLTAFTPPSTTWRPAIEVRSRRVGGATYQVPVEVRPERRRALAIRWLVNAARNRGENTMTRSWPANFSTLPTIAASREEARRHPQNGRSQPRLLALPLVSA
jgi:small subunit ribosomal protein S7